VRLGRNGMPESNTFTSLRSKKKFCNITDVVSSVLSVLITINQPGEKKMFASQKSKTKNIYIFKILKRPGNVFTNFLTFISR
jgi:hypothetical protein